MRVMSDLPDGMAKDYQRVVGISASEVGLSNVHYAGGTVLVVNRVYSWVRTQRLTQTPTPVSMAWSHPRGASWEKNIPLTAGSDPRPELREGNWLNCGL
jgi:hypothetical protein